MLARGCQLLPRRIGSTARFAFCGVPFRGHLVDRRVAWVVVADEKPGDSLSCQPTIERRREVEELGEDYGGRGCDDRGGESVEDVGVDCVLPRSEDPGGCNQENRQDVRQSCERSVPF